VFVVAAAAREIRLGLIICDLDGTLISSYMGTPNRRYNDWHVLPGRVEMLAALGEQGHRIAIATNQAGVAFGHVTESQARRKIAAALVALGLPDDTPIAVCFAHPQAKSYRYRNRAELGRRKPSGAMLRELMDAAGAHEDVVYVGDRPEDRQAARDARIAFRWAGEFFQHIDQPDLAPTLDSLQNRARSS